MARTFREHSATILVPIDGSKASMRGLKHALASACEGSTIHLLNVEPPLDDYGMVPAYLGKADHRRWTGERGRKLLAPAVEILERAGVAFKAHVVWGDAGPSIARTATRLRCGEIVMGTRGMGAMGGLFLGSVASKVVHHARVPVTLVK